MTTPSLPQKLLTEQALALPLSERVEMAQALWQSIDLDAQFPQQDAEQEALRLARRRDEELAAGDTTGRSHAQVMEAASWAIRCG
jgi:putative addiction module component (TIGR02574 family)